MPFSLYEFPEPVLARALNTATLALKLAYSDYVLSFSLSMFFWSVGVNSGFQVSQEKRTVGGRDSPMP
jgi:hypothetical protein